MGLTLRWLLAKSWAQGILGLVRSWLRRFFLFASAWRFQSSTGSVKSGRFFCHKLHFPLNPKPYTLHPTPYTLHLSSSIPRPVPLPAHFPRGSVCSTIMALGTRKPFYIGFWGAISRIVVQMDPLGSSICSRTSSSDLRRNCSDTCMLP